MAQPFGIGHVVGGRYRITHHVLTSADQDIVYQAVDQVLDRHVSVLLAARGNAKQVATSAKELATGTRASTVEVLDLGLAGDRTYLISSLVDPHQLLELVMPGVAPYMEPYYTDSLGSEIFGQSREMQPQTYDDDAEYYARMQSPSSSRSWGSRRPSFLDKVIPSRSQQQPVDAQHPEQHLDSAGEEFGKGFFAELGLVSDLDEVAVDADSDDHSESVGAAFAYQPEDARDFEAAQSDAPEPDQAGSGPQEHVEHAPSVPISMVPASGEPAAEPPGQAQQTVAEGEEVIDDPPEDPDPVYDDAAEAVVTELSEPQQPAPFGDDPAPGPAALPASAPPVEPVPAQEHAHSQGSFTGLISAVGPNEPSSFPGQETPDPVQSEYFQETDPEPYYSETTEEEQRSPVVRWVAAGALAALVLTAAIIMFIILRGGDDETASEDPPAAPPAEEPDDQDAPGDDDNEDDEAPSDDDEDDADQEDDEVEELPAPSISSISLDAGADVTSVGSANNLISSDSSSVWETYSYGTEEFGGFTSSVEFIIELDEATEVSEVSVVTDASHSGGSFEIYVNDEASLGGTELGTSDFSSSENTVSGEPIEGSYVIVSITALPTEDSPTVGDMPFRLNLQEITVE